MELECVARLGDCVEEMQKLDKGSAGLVFADPPFNIGYEYDEYKDKLAGEEYVAWTGEWLAAAYRALDPRGSLWFCAHDKFAAEMNLEAKRAGFHQRSWVVWYYTFGVNCSKNFTKSHTHIFYFTKKRGDFVFNDGDEAVRHPSARQLVYRDKRAARSRLPDDTWCLLKDQVEAQAQPMDDTWVQSRICGSFKERRGGHSCQMPEPILERIVRLSSNPGQLVVDPFCGTGTTAAVCRRLRRRCATFDISAAYVEMANKRIAETLSLEPIELQATVDTIPDRG